MAAARGAYRYEPPAATVRIASTSTSGVGRPEVLARLGVPVASLWVNLTPFFAILWSMAYGFIPNAYQIVGGLVALSGVVYMQVRKLRTPIAA